jgi:RHS repeat-associated protein
VADAASGLMYMQQRYYDPVIGRFLSTDPDPVNGLGTNFNRYAYVGNNPYRYVDPDGRNPAAVAAMEACGANPVCRTGARAAGRAIVKSAVSAVESVAGPAINIYLNEAINAQYAASINAQYAEEIDTESEGAQDEENPESSIGLPENPDELLDDGYIETSHPEATKLGHREFQNKETGDKLRFDKGKNGAPGHEGRDHYHRYNPDSLSKRDAYLDKAGSPVPRGSSASHLIPAKK